MSAAVVSIHDVAPATRDESAHLLALVDELGLRASLLVVPGPWKGHRLVDDPEFVNWLRGTGARGHEIVAHGWEHQAVVDPAVRRGPAARFGEQVLTRGCAEFAALGRSEAERRATLSLSAMRSCGFTPGGFVAPGWSLSTAASGVLAGVGFRYTTTRRAVVDLTASMSIAVPAVCHRPGSPISAVAARALVAAVEMRCHTRRPIRLALHPADVHDERLERASIRALRALRASALDVVTYAELIAGGRS